ncbi:peritrophin-1-like [Schistocerca cancellata]|uniref:peritrophin-1-like n=1 Tax=Schistocerca cancellata TaxID=274614 RepID=UPI0021190468|nr:peritrophin-1-like [Schistocerca cancellata]
MKVLAGLLVVSVLAAVATATTPTCPEDDGATAVFFPDDTDTHGYWECSSGKAVHMVCPDGLVWNSNINACDWPDSRK